MSDKQRFQSYRYWSHTWRLLPIGYRATFAKSETGHWHGGPVTHRGANCFHCGARLRLVWDINVLDPELPDMLRLVFPKITRLPLLYCFNCPQATTYQVRSDKTIKCLDPAGHDGGDETPYTSETVVPEILPRLPIAIERIDSVIDGLLSISHELGYGILDDSAEKLLLAFVEKNGKILSWGYGLNL